MQLNSKRYRVRISGGMRFLKIVSEHIVHINKHTQSPYGKKKGCLYIYAMHMFVAEVLIIRLLHQDSIDIESAQQKNLNRSEQSINPNQIETQPHNMQTTAHEKRIIILIEAHSFIIATDSCATVAKRCVRSVRF